MARPEEHLDTLRHEGDAAVEVPVAPDAGSATIRRVDESRYTVVREFGRGGQSVVYLAYDLEIGRNVAFKQLLPAHREAAASEGTLHDLEARFLREARVTGQLEHPNIVPVYEVGRRADGSLYYTQKLVRGRSLETALAACTSFAERLRLLPHFLGICQAIAYAHGRGVLHRDLKPSNVMLGAHGETIVLDWGLAKTAKDPAKATPDPVDSLLGTDSGRTREGSVMGTPAYMSPEQAEGAAADERSDVWSLGVILYELLAGRRPFEGRDTTEVLRAVRAGDCPPLRRVCPSAPPELAGIAERALQRDPNRRYQAGQALLDDVNAWFSGGRISAYDRPFAELRRWISRNRGLATLAGLSLLLLAAMAVQAKRQLASTRASLARAYVNAAHDAQRDYRWSDARRAYQAALDADDDGATRMEAAIDWTELVPVETVEAHAWWVSSVATSPDGRWVATGSLDGTVALRAAGSLEMVREFVVGESEVIGALAFSPDSRVLVSGHDWGRAVAWDTASGRTVADLHLPANPTSFAFAPDGKLLAIGTSDNITVLYDVAEGGLRERPSRAIGRAVAFSPDGKLLAAAFTVNSGAGTLRLYPIGDLQNPVVLGAGDRGYGRPHFLADGTLMTGARGVVLRWNVASRRQIGVIDEATSGLATAAIATSHDGRTLAIAGIDRAWVFDIASSRQLASIQLRAMGFDVAFSADDSEVLLATRSAAVLRWRYRPRLPLAADHRDVKFVPGGHHLAVASPAGIQLLDADSGRELAHSAGGASWIAVAAGDSSRIAVVRNDDAIDLLRAEDLSLESRMAEPAADAGRARSPSPQDPRTSIGLSGDGRRLYVAREGELVAMEVPTRRLLWRASAPWRDWFGVHAAADSPALAIDAREGLFLYDGESGREIAKLDVPYPALAFAGGRLLAGTPRGRLLAIDPRTGKVEREVAMAGSAAQSLQPSDIQRVFAAAALDGNTRIWDSATLQPLVQQPTPGNDFASLYGFSSDGRLLLFSDRSKGGLGIVRFGPPTSRF